MSYDKMDLTTLSVKELKAFYINIYNVIVIHATAILGTCSYAMDSRSR